MSHRAPCAPSPTVLAALTTLPVRESFRNRLAALCFLHYQSETARRFANRSPHARRALPLEPTRLNADCMTALM